MTIIPIRFKRGMKDNLPVSADAGEPLFTEDTHEMFIGTGDGIVPVSDPALKKRVEVLEQSRSTVAQYYTRTSRPVRGWMKIKRLQRLVLGS